MILKEHNIHGHVLRNLLHLLLETIRTQQNLLINVFPITHEINNAIPQNAFNILYPLYRKKNKEGKIREDNRKT